MMKIGVVGSRQLITKDLVWAVLDELALWTPDPICMISGGARITDTYAILWAINKEKEFKVIYPSGKIVTNPNEYDPEYHEEYPEYNRNHFFKRNELIAKESDQLICFIPKNKYQGGTWNTVKHFLNLKRNYLAVFNELGVMWDFKELPSWVQVKLGKIL